MAVSFTWLGGVEGGVEGGFKGGVEGEVMSGVEGGFMEAGGATDSALCKQGRAARALLSC